MLFRSQRKQQLPVIERRHARVDVVEWDELRVGLEVRQDADDGLRKVLIEGEQARHVRALSCRDGVAQVLRELSLKVERIVDRFGLNIRI